ncbi:MAG: hypothetical protein ACKV19_16475 [Verrucomicrobiales bacterium]
MRLALRVLALGVLASVAVWWGASGAHRGWSKNTVAVRTLDEITGIEQITHEDRFVPGIDTLAIGGAVAVVLAGLSFAFGRRRG